MLRKVVSVLSVLVVFFTLSAFSSPSVGATTPAPVSTSTSIESANEIKTNFVNPYRNRKKNVRISYEWSPYKRVSDNLNTYGSSGGSLTSNRTVTFKTDVSGSIQGLGISTGASVSSSIGYTLNVPKNRTVYMGYRVYYKVERGTNETYDVVTGKVIRSNSYTVKTPLYGQYGLVNY
ncbi:hypothetical protein [Aeribacillus pallidus]|uniref:Uncharacterized protein n=1 Tax=Aeribacillus pallidus TaxID=33936 RepID=A0A165WWP4_9BACI|nr:hypothetical protein [Aeribacillus pallidus]KZN95405.1 hypothetical protein AZI98_14215 [Aeribacillus pallidus]